ncbi:hypothetical protein M426DRAFT_11417 [Hypoxylon sp. CI-4A]|nr:hypothetical protein M426DRAFT_11417 [Hypoxylon sp. CI-4A]
MDPLSISIASITVLQACNSILHICYNTRAILKNKPWCLSRVQDEIRELRGVLEAIFQLAVGDHDSKGDCGENTTLRLLADSQASRGPLILCQEDLQMLEELLVKKFQSPPKTKAHAIMQAISWDLSEREVKPIIDRLSRSKAALNLAISADEVALLFELRKLSSSTADDVLNISRTLSDLTTEVSIRNIDERQKQVLKWLSPVDPWESYVPAVNRCHEGTGQWFLKSKDFQDWKDWGGSNIWLSGFPGSGKTTLMSNIIRDLALWAQQDEARPTIAYFYCDFRDSKTQDLANLLGTVVRRVILQKRFIPEVIEEAYNLSTAAGNWRKPHASLLIEALQLLTCNSPLILLVDALDEIEDREEALDFFRRAADSMSNITFLVTSREEQSIRRSLTGFRNIRIEDRVFEVDKDIGKYVDYRLRVDPNLQWLNVSVKEQISESMRTQATGMFRWVQCQLETFSKLRTVKAIRQSLSQPPKDLHETYNRILGRIPKADQESARRVLLWVSFSITPLTLEEIHTAIAIDSGMDHLDEESLLRSPHDILDLVGGLINVTGEGHVTLAHMSVKDYLLSSNIRSNPATSDFALSIDGAHATLFECCMAYISFSDFRKGPSTTSEDYLRRLNKFPLLRHAAISWPYYYRLSKPSEDLTATVQAINADDPMSWDFYPRHATSLYYAATFGLTEVVNEFIKRGAELDRPGSRYGGTALHGAVYRVHMPAVKLLLEAGADVNKADFLNVSPLHTAATLDDIELVELLLEFSANTKALDDAGETPLDWALKSGQIRTHSVLQGVPVANKAEAKISECISVWKASNTTIPYFPDILKTRPVMDHCIKS